MQPIGNCSCVWTAHSLHTQGLVDSFFDDRKRFHQDADRLQFGWHLHDILLAIDGEFRLVSVQSTDASLAILAGLTHIGSVHHAAGAFAAAPPYGEHGVVAGLHASNGRAYAHHLAKHFMTDDQFLLTIRGIGAASRNLFPIGAADAHSDNSDFDFILRGNRRLRPFHQTRADGTRNDSNCFHAPSLSSKWSPTRSAFAMMVRLGFTAAIDTKKLASTT